MSPAWAMNGFVEAAPSRKHYSNAAVCPLTVLVVVSEKKLVPETRPGGGAILQ